MIQFFLNQFIVFTSFLMFPALTKYALSFLWKSLLLSVNNMTKKTISQYRPNGMSYNMLENIISWLYEITWHDIDISWILTIYQIQTLVPGACEVPRHHCLQVYQFLHIQNEIICNNQYLTAARRFVKGQSWSTPYPVSHLFFYSSTFFI